jgi:cellulose synthase operon protein C
MMYAGAPTAAEQEQRETAGSGEREIASALRLGVCTVAETRIQDIGVDPVDPRILERALRIEDDQLPYGRRGVDARLQRHLTHAAEGGEPGLVCLSGSSKAGKSRSMLQALKAELPQAALVVPDRTRENMQTIIDCDVLQDIAAQYDGHVVLWLDDLEGFARVGNTAAASRPSPTATPSPSSRERCRLGWAQSRSPAQN